MQSSRLLRPLVVLLTALMTLAPGATRAAAPATGVWTVTGAMHEARSYQTAALLPNGLVLLTGGANRNGFLATAELYNPRTGKWTATGSMHYSRIQFTATLLRDGQVLAAGGFGNTGYPARAELYNPRTGKWTLTGAMRTPRDFHTATLLSDGRVLVAGGVAGACDNNGNCTGITAGAEIYDPHTGRWTATGSMHQARARQTATLLPDGEVLITGGSAGGAETAGSDPLAGAELYHPHTGSWATTGSLHTAAAAQAATLLPNGLVLVEGGSNSRTWITGAELYHPLTGTWTVTGSLHEPRGYQTGQTATLLHNGQILVVGGCLNGGCRSVTRTAELYNPSTGIWTITGSLRQGRAWEPATLLPGGQVLVPGGSTTANFSTALTSAELYQP